MPHSATTDLIKELMGHAIFDIVGTNDFYDELEDKYGVTVYSHLDDYHLMIAEIAKLSEADQQDIVEGIDYNIREHQLELNCEEITEQLEDEGATPNTVTFAQLLTQDLYDSEGTAELYEYLQCKYGVSTRNGRRDHYLIVAEFAKLAEADQLQILETVQQAIREDLAARRDWEPVDEFDNDHPTP